MSKASVNGSFKTHLNMCRQFFSRAVFLSCIYFFVVGLFDNFLPVWIIVAYGAPRLFGLFRLCEATYYGISARFARTHCITLPI